MQAQLIVILGLVSMLWALFACKERDPLALLVCAVGTFIVGVIYLLIIKGGWLLISLPWN